ncbi:MAG TPA: YceI family protein [Candidatus Binatia bacterium]|jgi:polyisoprenoid-binding protein YceI
MRRSVFFFCVGFALALLSPPGGAEMQRFRLIPEESQITTKIADPFGNAVDGALRLRQGEARGDLDRLQETASVSLVIDAASYNSNIGLRDQDVQEYYLEVQRYAVIRLDSAGVQEVARPRSAEEPWRITLKARLELHGVKKELTAPVRLVYQGNKIVAQGSFQILLDDFKIDVPRLLFMKAGNRIDVDFRIAGERLP